MPKAKKELLTERIQMRITPSLRKAINATRGKGKSRLSFNQAGIDLWKFALTPRNPDDYMRYTLPKK